MSKPNRLSTETSPYLQQHQNNPVDWFPWGDEALSKAKREKKPIFLSIGYSACHWCHVMERESFEDGDTAVILNELFVSIKVDREERPDLDHLYLTAVQAMSGHGGWPLTVFLTPELQPFYGGTYFPKEDRAGSPSFKKILAGVSGAWKNKTDEVKKQAQELTNALIGMQKNDGQKEGHQVDQAAFTTAAEKLLENYDSEYGGMGGAPKFFHTADFRFLLKLNQVGPSEKYLAPVEKTLAHLANGGVYDQLGGGFHRYSTDRTWLAPHFEKMLYDNALLVPLFLDAYQVTKNSEWARVARETLDYLQREMTSENGSFFSTQDADSEGVEGKFFVWNPGEIQSALDAQLFSIAEQVFDLPEHGNWEEKIILTRKVSLAEAGKRLKLEATWVEDNFAVLKMKLFDRRFERTPPHTDTKVVVAWNGMAISAFARGYAVLGSDSYRSSAENCAAFLLKQLGIWDEKKLVGLHHTFKDGIAKIPAFLDDYAGLCDGLISLFSVTWETKWLDAAVSLANLMVAKFWDESAQAFFYTGLEHADLLTRVRDYQDGATPSGSSMAFTALIRLSQITGTSLYRPVVEKGLASLTPYFTRQPAAVSHGLNAAHDWNQPHVQWITITNKATLETAKEGAREHLLEFRPNVSRWVIEESEASRIATKYPVLSKKNLAEGNTRHFVCVDFACKAPTENETLAASEAGYRG